MAIQGQLLDYRDIHFIVRTFLCASVAFLLSCAQYSSIFNRIDDNKLRVIGVNYLPLPEMAPGDTLTARIHFAGNEVVNVDNFTLSFRGVSGGNDVAFEEEPLTIINTVSWLPDSFQYSFKISDSIFLQKQSWYLDPMTADTTARFLLQPGNTIRQVLDSLSQQERLNKIEQIKRMMLVTYTLCTAESKKGNTLRILSKTCIRYNKWFPDLLPVNHNPSLDWVAVYQVPRAQAIDFTPYETQSVPTIKKTYLYYPAFPDSVDTTIVVDTGYSYFFAADNGLRFQNGQIDTVRDTEITSSSQKTYESYLYKWFYQNVDTVTAYADSMLLIDDQQSGSVVEFRPPQTVAMHRFKIWVAVWDEQNDSRFYRPVGTTFKALSGAFTFTDAYRRAMGQE